MTYINENTADQEVAHDPLIGTGANATRLSALGGGGTIAAQLTETMHSQGLNIEAYPIQTPETDDTQRFVRLFNDIGPCQTINLQPNTTYNITSFPSIPTGFKLKGNGASINFNASSKTLFSALNNNEDIVFEDVYLNDPSGTNTAFDLEGTGGSSLANYLYSKKITLRRVFTNGFLQDGKVNFARQIQCDNCFFYSKNGWEILNKSVEINFHDTIVYCSSFTTNSFGIKLDSTTGQSIDYPEGIHITGSTAIDGFYRSIWVNNVFDLQIGKCYIGADVTSGDSTIYFGKGTADHVQDIHIDAIIYGQPIKFIPGTTSPVSYRAKLNIIAENINGENIHIDNWAQDIEIDVMAYPSSNGIIANCVNNNANVRFGKVYGGSGCVSGIQVKGSGSHGSRIDSLNYDGTGDALYLEQPVLLGKINGVTTQTIGYSNKFVNLPQGTAYGQNTTIASITMSIAKGQKGIITVAGHATATTGNPILSVNYPTGIVIPNGTGWNAQNITPVNGQYVAVSIPFYANTDITNGSFTIDNIIASSTITFDYHAYMAIQLN